MGIRLKGAAVVVTGASSGIGRATALEFASHGANLALTARRGDYLDDLALECTELGADVLVMPADVRDEEALRDLAWRAVEAFGGIDVWVNNAGVTVFGRFDEAPSQDCRAVIETNLFGCINGAKAVLPYFREQGEGVLINIASVAGKVGTPYQSCYAASKFAIAGLSESLRMEYLDEPDIHVCTVMPAAIDTPFWQHGANYTGFEINPLKPLYDVRDVAKAIVKVARSPRKETFVGSMGRVHTMMRRVFPALAERLMASSTEATMFSARREMPNPGSLYEPDWAWADADGGWQEREGGRLTSPRGLAKAGLAAGLGWFLWQSLFADLDALEARQSASAQFSDRSREVLAGAEWWEPASQNEQSAFWRRDLEEARP